MDLNKMRRRNWCFTDFDLLEWGEIYARHKTKIRYMGVGIEICPDTGKKHVQGMVQFNSVRRMGGIKFLFGSKKIHLEPMKGTCAQNEVYCSKGGMYTEWGKYTQQGARSDLDAIKVILDNNGTMKSVAESHFGDFCRYNRGFAKYKELVLKGDTVKWRTVEVIWISGPTGSGKTRMACAAPCFMIAASQMGWWDGYEGEKTLCIDEYANDGKITHMLSLLDGYQKRLPIKGGFTYANWDKVYVTTNLRWAEVHPRANPSHVAALERRITKKISFWPDEGVCHEVGGNTMPPLAVILETVDRKEII